MAIIVVDIVFDTVRILADQTGGATPDKAAGLSHPDNVIANQRQFMVVNYAHLDPAHQDSQATANLWVVAHPGDTIHWRAESLSDNAVNAAIIYKIIPNTSSNPNTLTTPQTVVQSPSIAVPNVQDVTTYRVESQTRSIVTAEVNSTGRYDYLVYFYIVPRDPSGDKFLPAQYYYWDPTINVTTVST